MTEPNISNKDVTEILNRYWDEYQKVTGLDLSVAMGRNSGVDSWLAEKIAFDMTMARTIAQPSVEETEPK